MAPEYGATCGFFPIDARTIQFLRSTGRSEKRVTLVEAYAKAQGMFRDVDTPIQCSPKRSNLYPDSVRPSLAGPKRPQDRVLLSASKQEFLRALN